MLEDVKGTLGYQIGYDIGHTEGESCRQVDWEIALYEILPDGFDITPSNVAKLLKNLLEHNENTD